MDRCPVCQEDAHAQPGPGFTSGAPQPLRSRAVPLEKKGQGLWLQLCRTQISAFLLLCLLWVWIAVDAPFHQLDVQMVGTSRGDPSPRHQFNPLRLPSPDLPDLSQIPRKFHPVYKRLAAAQYSAAWDLLLLLQPGVVPPEVEDLVHVLSRVLPFLGAGERETLLGKFLRPLRGHPGYHEGKLFGTLELAVARWLSGFPLRASVGGEQWHQDLQIQVEIQICFSFALRNAGLEAEVRPAIYVEASRSLAQPLFALLPRVGKGIDDAIATKNQGWLEDTLQRLHLFRQTFSLDAEERGLVSPHFARMVPFFARLDRPSAFNSLLLELQEDDQPFPKPYVQRLREENALSREEKFTLFPSILGLFDLSELEASRLQAMHREIALPLRVSSGDFIPSVKIFALPRHFEFSITSLDLGSNKIGAEGAKALAALLPQMAHLTDLWLGSNEIGAEGARTLAAALPQMPNIKGLDLSANEIGAGGARALAAALPQMTHLIALCLGRNEIGVGGAKALAAVLPQLAHLTELDLRGNEIDDEGAKALAAVLPQVPSLTFLDLSSNGIGAEGAQALAAALPQLPHLTFLSLWNNGIGEEGAKALAAAPIL